MSTPSNPQPAPNAITQLRVEAQRRQQGSASIVFTPDLIYIIDTVTSPPSPYSIVMTDATGLINPSLLPPITTVLLETNGVPNSVQNILNLKSGTNVTLTADAFGGVTIATSPGILLETNSVPNPDQAVLNIKQGTNIALSVDAFGGVTISASGTFGTSFSNITSGENDTADMQVGAGAQITYVGSGSPPDFGVVNANEIGGINVVGNVPAHPGQILISQPGNKTAVWADPLVQGLYPDGTPISTPINPVYVGGKGTDGELHGILTTPSGAVVVVSGDEQEASLLQTFSANTSTGTVPVTTRRPILSIQPKTGSSGITFLLRKFRLVGNGATAFFELVLNGVLTGASFASVNPSSNMNFDTAAILISGGQVVDSGYLNLGPEEPDLLLHFGFSGSPAAADTFSLVVTSMGSSIPISGSFRWTEEATSL